MKRISVLMSTYNGEKYLDEQIQSLYDQEDVAVDLYVRDDLSTDETVNILKKWEERTVNDPRFFVSHYIGHKSLGAAKSFMDLIMTVPLDNEYYAFCDQDDKWLPNKLKVGTQKVFDENDNNKEVPFLYYSNTIRVGEQLETIDNPFKKKYSTQYFGESVMSTAAGGLTFVFNKALIKKLKEYEPGYLPMHDRWVMLVCLSLGGSVYYDHDGYVLYRQHSKNVTGGSSHIKLKGLGLFVFRLKKLFTYKDFPSVLAKELIEGYEKDIPKHNLDILLLLGDGRKFKNRFKILFSRELKTGYYEIDTKLAMQTLFGKI